jgi:hypothetical protein
MRRFLRLVGELKTTIADLAQAEGEFFFETFLELTMNNKMKYIVTIILTILSFARDQSFAQGFNVGIKVGSNFNQFTQPGMSLGYNAGAYLSYQVLPYLIGKFEPQFSQIGGTLDPSKTYFGNQTELISEVAYSNRNIKLQTVEFPLLAELFLPEFTEEKIVPKLILGGSYALMVKGVETHRISFYSSGATIPAIDVGYQHDVVTDNYARNQFSAIAGIGLQFKTEMRDFQFDFRYRQGLTQISMLQFPSGAQDTTPYTDGPGGKLFTSSFSINFSMNIFKF